MFQKIKEKDLISLKSLKSQFNITIALGTRTLKRTNFENWSHGKISPFDILAVVSALEIILTSNRNVNYIGTGITQFMEVIRHES